MTPVGGYRLVVIGASLGGLRALQCVLAALPADFPLPVLIVQHRVRDNDALASVLRPGLAVRVADADDKQPLEAGQVLLAPPDYHLLVEPDGTVCLSLDEPVMHARPSIDVLFESAADAFADRVVGVALTSASADGARGLARIASMGGVTIVQDPATAEAPTLPRAALEAVGAVDHVLPVADIGALLVRLAR